MSLIPFLESFHHKRISQKNADNNAQLELMIDQNLLPNLLIIGAAKSGTSALHAYLSQHPQIFMTTPTIRGESSTAYLANPWCAAKIKKLIPNVKIISILRNPADRAFSNYVMYKNWRIEKKFFGEAVNEEIETGRCSYPQQMRYLSLGKYTDSLKTYFSLFRKEQVRVYLYDDFRANPELFLKDIFQYLGVDDTFIPDVQKKHNTSFIRRYAENPRMDKALHFAERGFRKLKIPFGETFIHDHRFYKPVLKTEVRKKLVNFYADEISALEKLLNKDLSTWRV